MIKDEQFLLQTTTTLYYNLITTTFTNQKLIL
jgi:hypothetical protein